ncbi:hypothetical protein H6M51_09960 [Rhizobium sp. AQ_MP]|uniref:hypothetical protein n=1 Tax=Rhizobium sp. AQ_MP TaxID=2761536 RepID=UPI00163AD0F5|nr:hypothetical protein [Rhizobium sp. AQ_MP]MBC2773188.1 hypothetical protein [Rhizobium sp. AQ_MP]
MEISNIVNCLQIWLGIGGIEGCAPNGYALALAVLTPVLFIYARNEMRQRRLLVIRDFLTSYPETAKPPQDRSGENSYINPSVEFVRSKYVQGISRPKKKDPTATRQTPIEEIDDFIASTKLLDWSDLRLLITSSGMMIVTYYGADALLRGLSHKTSSPCLIACGTTLSSTMTADLYLIAGLAFAGAYLAAIRGFMRGLAAFDLSPITFLRYAVETIVSVVFIVAAYRAIPDPTLGIRIVADTGGDAALPRAPTPTQLPEVSHIWLLLAPVLGYLPDSASKFVILRLQSLISWVKMDDDRFNKVTRITPLDALDGIDYATRFRLQESGIYDVQGLATYNPIMLHIETPYGIYQAVDWIAQAQLCHLVGLEKFLVLRELQIRTIFDLERAIDFRKTGSETSDSPDEFDLLLAGVLIAPTQNLRDVCTTGGVQLLMVDQQSIKPAANPDEFCRWFREKLGIEPANVKARVEHMLGWIADDLHVRRLRRIWQDISDSLGERSKRLDGELPKPPGLG